MKESMYKKAWEQGYSYEAYSSLIEKLVEEGKTTGDEQSESLIDYTKLNAHRMQRIEKTVRLKEGVVETFKKLSHDMRMLVITEAWCGDAAHAVPVASALARESGMDLRLILRDANPTLMESHLTDGAKSIPVILFLDDAFEVVAQWGPRPAPAQEMAMEYKHEEAPKRPYEEFAKQLQLWYAKDKYQTMQNEWQAAVEELAQAES